MSRVGKRSQSPMVYEQDVYEASPEPSSHQFSTNIVAHSMSPSPDVANSSDKENRQQRSAAEKGKGRADALPSRLSVSAVNVTRAAKRQRRDNPATTVARNTRRERTREIFQDDDNRDDGEDGGYDPDQNVEERRRLRQGLRDLTNDLNDNRSDYLKATSRGLITTLEKANRIAASVKQTSDATIDSRLVVTAADLSYRKTVQLTLGDSALGVDVDELLSKCIVLMKSAGASVQTQPVAESGRRRSQATRQRLNDDGEDGEDGDMLNWEALGNLIMQHNNRPATAGFLLGPLSIEKRARKVSQRKATLKISNLRQTQPEVLRPEDIERNENSNLTTLCAKILAKLKQVQNEREDAVEAEATEDMSPVDLRSLMFKHGVHAEGGVDFFKFVVNPNSFGQTVENMFYVSFLIRDGKASITIDEDGLPAIEATEPRDRSTEAGKGASKHQAVLDIDMASWQEIIDTFEITDPMIPHRKEEESANVSARGWYS